MAHTKSAKSGAKKGPRSLQAKAVGGKKAGSVRGGKRLDAATPKLHEAACKGTHLPEVTIELW